MDPRIIPLAIIVMMLFFFGFVCGWTLARDELGKEWKDKCEKCGKSGVNNID